MAKISSGSFFSGLPEHKFKRLLNVEYQRTDGKILTFPSTEEGRKLMQWWINESKPKK